MNRKETLLNFLEKSPQDTFLLYAMAMELMSEQDFLKAIEYLLKTKDINSDYLALYYQLGYCYEQIQDEEKAILAYQLGIEIAQKQNEKKTEMELLSALEQLIY